MIPSTARLNIPPGNRGLGQAGFPIECLTGFPTECLNRLSTQCFNQFPDICQLFPDIFPDVFPTCSRHFLEKVDDMGRESTKIVQIWLGFVRKGSGSPKNTPNNSKYVLKKNTGNSENLIFLGWGRPIFPLGASPPVFERVANYNFSQSGAHSFETRSYQGVLQFRILGEFLLETFWTKSRPRANCCGLGAGQV